MSGNDEAARPAWQRAMPFLLIGAVGALAHLWCLGSQYFLDDVLQIRDNTHLRTGEWWRVSYGEWTYFWYWVQYKLFGLSPVGVHFVNWLLHTAVAVVVYLFGRETIPLERPGRIALAAALVFVAHPLASEIPNYARTQDIAWVTLFSLLASLAAVKAVRSGSWQWAVAVLLCVVGATFSKGPGLGHAAMMVVIAVGGCAPREAWTVIRRRWPLLVGTCLVGGLLLWWTGIPSAALAKTVPRWGDDHFFGWHAVTLCRVFWKFVGLFFFPKGLSSDHFIPMTVSWEDPQAVPAVVGLVLWMPVATALLFRARTRFYGMCLWLFGGAIAYRVLYVINEFMPEYRIYPGLPWLCLGVVVMAAVAWRRATKASPAGLVTIVVAVLCLVSTQRSFKWHSLDTLCADVLDRYPYQARALWMLQRRDVPAGQYDEAIRRYEDLQNAQKAFRKEQKRIAPGRRLSDGHNAMSEIAVMGYVAESLAALGQEQQARMVLAQLEKNLVRNKIKRGKGGGDMLWGLLAMAKGRVHEQLGEYEAALASFEGLNRMHYRWVDVERVKKKLADQSGGAEN